MQIKPRRLRQEGCEEFRAILSYIVCSRSVNEPGGHHSEGSSLYLQRFHDWNMSILYLQNRMLEGRKLQRENNLTILKAGKLQMEHPIAGSGDKHIPSQLLRKLRQEDLLSPGS